MHRRAIHTLMYKYGTLVSAFHNKVILAKNERVVVSHISIVVTSMCYNFKGRSNCLSRMLTTGTL